MIIRDTLSDYDSLYEHVTRECLALRERERVQVARAKVRRGVERDLAADLKANQQE